MTPEMTTTQHNPYLAGRQAWDERYGDLIVRARNWRLAALAALSVAFASVVGIVLMAKQSRVIPYVVAVDQLGRTVASGFAEESQSVDDRLLRSGMQDFVMSWRQVTLDWTLQKRSIDRVFAGIAQGSRAQVAISEWYKAAPPQERAKLESIEIEVTTVLPTAERAYEVDWVETRRSSTGQLIGKDSYKGHFAVALHPPTDEKEARQNPLGLYVTSASWSKVI
jgi:type IV secretion system protein TrbF